MANKKEVCNKRNGSEMIGTGCEAIGMGLLAFSIGVGCVAHGAVTTVAEGAKGFGRAVKNVFVK